jgi:hypothetical protein
MPLTSKGQEIKASMEKQYGQEKGESVFYASANKGAIKGVHDAVAALADAVSGLSARFDTYDDKRAAAEKERAALLRTLREQFSYLSRPQLDAIAADLARVNAILGRNDGRRNRADAQQQNRIAK